MRLKLKVYALLICCLLFILTSCSSESYEKEDLIIENSDMQLLAVQYDHDKILCETYYNTRTNEYWIYKYDYSYRYANIIGPEIISLSERVPTCSCTTNMSENNTSSSNIEFPTILLDEANIKITLLEYNGKDEYWDGASLKILIENNSEELIYYRSASEHINNQNFDMSTSFTAGGQVEPGKEDLIYMILLNNELIDANINVVNKIEFQFEVYPTSGNNYMDWIMLDPIAVKTVTINFYN